MERQSRIIPEFMSDSPDDTFRIIMPLNLKLDYENYGNSHFNVIIKNETTEEHFLYEMSPELFFTHFSVEKYYLNAQENKKIYNKHIFSKNFIIDTDVHYNYADVKLKDIFSEKNIVSLLGWKRKFLGKAEHLHCYHLQSEEIDLIIPHYAIAIYYYYRCTPMREAALNSNLEDLFVSCDLNDDEATIILKERRTDIDAAFIHRYACNDTARKAFDDIGTHINSHLRIMKDKYNKEEPKTIPIKAKFPVKEEFTLDARVSKIYNEETQTSYYFVYEILNDSSDIGFTKFNKLIETSSTITETDDLEKLPKVDKTIPSDTTEILKIENASKKHTRNEVATNRKKYCNSLAGVQVETAEITSEEKINLLTIYEETQSDEPIDQSLTESSSSGKKTIRKTVVSSSEDAEPKEPSQREYTHNFDEFNKYVDFLSKESLIKNFQSYGNQKMKQIINEETEKINPKCKIKKRERQYITATFEYNNYYVGLLELENGNKSYSGTWVIVSKSPVGTGTFDKFLDLYTVDYLSIKDIKKGYQFGSDPKFTTKNHERTEQMTDNHLANWAAKLLGKVAI